MSKTPRTDALIRSSNVSGDRPFNAAIDMCKELEAKLSVAQAKRAALTARCEKFKKIADDVLRANPLIVDQRATAEAVRRAEQAESALGALQLQFDLRGEIIEKLTRERYMYSQLAAMVSVPREVKEFFDFAAYAFVPFTSQQEEIKKSLEIAMKALAAAGAKA